LCLSSQLQSKLRKKENFESDSQRQMTFCSLKEEEDGSVITDNLVQEFRIQKKATNKQG
jgi:hypothetical protein